jgi:hypothetical protein
VDHLSSISVEQVVLLQEILEQDLLEEEAEVLQAMQAVEVTAAPE